MSRHGQSQAELQSEAAVLKSASLFNHSETK